MQPPFPFTASGHLRNEVNLLDSWQETVAVLYANHQIFMKSTILLIVYTVRRYYNSIGFTLSNRMCFMDPTKWQPRQKDFKNVFLRRSFFL